MTGASADGGTDAATGAGRRLHLLIAPDSFKGSLSSVAVARALAEGWRRARPDDSLDLAPLADGGEGTLAALEAAGGWERRETAVADPIGRPIRATWLRSAGGRRAVVELADASGLSRLAAAERAPLTATTRGTGELLRAVLDEGIRDVVLGIGGSATSDGGRGILEALGIAFGADSTSFGAAAVSLDGLDPRLVALQLRIACDVTNPLLGEHGAAATYGPQKGASPDQVRELDERLARHADALEAATGRSERSTPGAGAAGGTAFGLLCLRDRFRSLELRPGVELVMEAVGFADRLAAADLVLTGEGHVDAQTAFGKTAQGVARRAAEAGRPCIAVGGGVEPEGVEALGRLGVVVVPVIERPMLVEEAMAAGPAPLERAGERLARLISLGMAFS